MSKLQWREYLARAGLTAAAAAAVSVTERAVGAYGRINDGKARRKPVITFPA